MIQGLLSISHNGSVTGSEGYQWLYDVVDEHGNVYDSELTEEEAKAWASSYNNLLAKADLFDELIVAYRVKFSINDNAVSLMTLVDEFAHKTKELKCTNQKK